MVKGNSKVYPVILTGRQSNRAIRGLTFVFEALLSLNMLESSFRWSVKRDQFCDIPLSTEMMQRQSVQANVSALDKTFLYGTMLL